MCSANPAFTGTIQLGTAASGGGTIYKTTDGINIDPYALGNDSGTLYIKGSLEVLGTQTVINSTSLSITDKRVKIAKDATSNSQLDGAGIILGASSMSTRPSILYSNADDNFEINKKNNHP